MTFSTGIIVGSHVWVEDPDVAWIDGEVFEVNGEDVKVNCTSGNTGSIRKSFDSKVVVNISRVYPKDPEAPQRGADDMTKLGYLHEPGVLENLSKRYDMNEIYTYTGSILIAVNPFQRLAHLYDKHVMEKYKGAALGELNPHPFAIADAAYMQMINEGISQSILVSGESGAGKTESTKMLMHYLAYMGGRAASEGQSVEQQVLESNPVLEAFGNAKTVKNNNSSRFGKFVEIQFDGRARISGAAIRTYLLERSRVCQVSDPERNYHCFYMLCAAPPKDIERYKLGNPRTFHYLNQSSFYELDGVDDSREYIATRNAMGVVGISPDEQDAIFRVIAAILHLGNIKFVKGNETDSSEPQDDQSIFHLKTAAELLMCNEKALEDSLCKRVIVTRDESITKCLDPNAAALNRDALAKTIYSRLFDWIVNKINKSIGQDPKSKCLIGVLDIYGFESFKTNSFEQFCINLTNEKLQQHFNQHVFKMEQEEYSNEEIDWSYIDFVDNQDILDLIEKKPGGIIALLDEACMFPRSTHETFAQKLYQTFKDHKRISKPKLSPTDFTIHHYAGDVTYQTEHFLDKNKDYVVPEQQALLSASRCAFVSGLFPPLPEESPKSSKFSSIGSQFKQQLQSLLETLSATEPRYIRCIKPNNLLKPFVFENQNVLQQLRCGGVMEAIRISCAGYPTRKTFDEFTHRFCILASDILKGSCDELTACKRILERVHLSGYQIGKTKVFLRAGQMAELDARRSEVLGESASIIQRKVRSYFARRNFIQLRVSAIQIQASCRGEIARHLYECLRREAACLRIQKDARMFLARRKYIKLYLSAIPIQTGMRGMAARILVQNRKKTQVAIFIQSHCRQYLARLHYLRLKKAAIITQCAWRGKMARRELQKLKMAAKETGALQEAKSKLEKEVEELTWHLQFEKRTKADLAEAKSQENAELKSALEETRLQFQETKELLIKEREAAQKAAELVTLVEETPVVKQEVVNELSAENKQLKDLVTSLEKKIDETEKIYEELSCLRETALKVAEVVPVLDQEIVNQLTQENRQLKDLVNSLEKKIDETEKRYEETSYLREAAKKAAEVAPVSQAVPVVDQEIVNQLTAENQQLKDLVNLLERKIDETEKRYEETNCLREAAKKAAEVVPVSQEIPVVYQETVNQLTAENDQLKDLVNLLEKRIDETEKRYEETSRLSEERLKQALDAETKIIALKTAMQRLEEKLLDMETQDQILRQQALLGSAPGKMSGNLVVQTKPTENGHHEPHGATATKTFGNSDSGLRRSNVERQRECQDALMNCITQDLGFSEGKPVAAYTIFKCLVHWRSFETERTNVFDRLIQMIGSAIEVESNDACMGYWLSNTSTLLFLLQQTLKATSSTASKPPQPTSFFGRMTQSFRSSPSSSNLSIGGLEGVRQVEAKYPALLFKQQLTAYVEKIYGIIRDNQKKELSSFISSCIQAPTLSRVNSSRASGQSSGNSSLSSPWEGMINSLNGLLNILNENFIPSVLSQKIFTQVFSYINVQLFNSLLLRRECCTFDNGEYVKAGLAELELWCGKATEEYVGSSWDELKHARQAVGFLVIHQKSRISYDELTNDLCPEMKVCESALSVQQLYRICTLYCDDNYHTPHVDPEVMSNMKILMTEEANVADSQSFMLDDNSSIPFSVDDICLVLKDKNFKGVQPAMKLLENPAFRFLEE